MGSPFGGLSYLAGFGAGQVGGYNAQQRVLEQMNRCQQSTDAGFFNYAAAVDAKNAVKKCVGTLSIQEELQAEVDEWLPQLA